MRFYSYIVFSIFIVLISFFMYFKVDFSEIIDHKLQDLVFQSRQQKKIDSRISIIAIDDKSMKELGRWPWPRSVIADAVNQLSKGNPAVIGIDIMFFDQTSAFDDAKLVQAVRNANNVVLPVKGSFTKKANQSGIIKAIKIEEPFPKLNEGTIKGHINNYIDPDNVVRRSWNEIAYDNKIIKSFAWEVCNQYFKNVGKPILEKIEPQDTHHMSLIKYDGISGDYEHVSLIDVLNGTVPPLNFKGKIVLIAPYSEGLLDEYMTPIDFQKQMSGGEINATIIQNILDNSFKEEVPYFINILVLIILGCICFLTFKRFSLLKSLIIYAVLILIYLYLTKLCFSYGFVVSIFYPLLLTALVYLIIPGVRYIEEYLERKRVIHVFGRYVAPQVVGQILKGGKSSLRLGVTRREISVLFVDIRGFTRLSEEVQPEEVADILNEYLDLVASAIFKYDGTLDKFIGDGAMAIFNAPLNQEDHVLRACETAWEMKKAADTLQNKVFERFGQNLQFGIGINSGYAVVGNIGNAIRMDYTAIGDTVNIAAKLVSCAMPGQILLSQATYELVREKVYAVNLGERSIKGKEKGVCVYQMEGLR